MTVYAPWAQVAIRAPQIHYTPNPTQLRQQWPRNTGTLARNLQAGLAPSLSCDSLDPNPAAWYDDPPSVLGSVEQYLESPMTQIQQALLFLSTRHARSVAADVARRDFDLLQMQLNAFLAAHPLAFWEPRRGRLKAAPSSEDAPVWAELLRFLDTASPVSRGLLSSYPQLNVLASMWGDPHSSLPSATPCACGAVGVGTLALGALALLGGVALWKGAF
jgi:hypothetical protein